MGSGASDNSNQPWHGQVEPLDMLYDRAMDNVANQPTPYQYGERPLSQRANTLQNTTGIDAYNREQLDTLDLDPKALQAGLQTGGSYIPFSPVEMEAQNRAVDLARSGIDPSLAEARSGLSNNAGLGYLDESASGQYLTADTNPYLADAVRAAQDPLIERFQAEILPGVTGQFGAAGRFGSGAHQYAVNQATDDFTKNLADAATQAYAANYMQERANQLSAQQGLAEGIQRNVALSPGIADAIRQQEISNLGLLEGVGGAQSGKIEDLLSSQENLYNMRANDERERLKEYASLIQGTPILPGGQAPQKNKSAGALGGAASGAATGAMLGSYWPGYGTAIGAVAGGLVGGLGGYYA